MAALRFRRTGAALFGRRGGRHAAAPQASTAPAAVSQWPGPHSWPGSSPDPLSLQSVGPRVDPSVGSSVQGQRADHEPSAVRAGHSHGGIPGQPPTGLASQPLPVEVGRSAVTAELGFRDGSAMNLSDGDPWAGALRLVAEQIIRPRSGAQSGA